MCIEDYQFGTSGDEIVALVETEEFDEYSLLIFA